MDNGYHEEQGDKNCLLFAYLFFLLGLNYHVVNWIFFGINRFFKLILLLNFKPPLLKYKLPAFLNGKYTV